MKRHLGILLVFVLASAMGCLTGHSAIVKLMSGSLDFLRPETQVNLEYVYDGMTVLDKDKKADREEGYLAKRTAEYNGKVPGKGDRWRAGWFSDRADSYQPKFSQLLNKSLTARKSKLQFGTFKDARYTLVLKTTYTEIGWKFSDVIQHPFCMSGQAVFLDTENRTNVVAVISITKSPGSGDGTDFATRRGLAEAYAKAGKELGAYLGKALK